MTKALGNYTTLTLTQAITKHIEFVILITLPSNITNDLLAIYILALHPLKYDPVSGCPSLINCFCCNHLEEFASAAFSLHLLTGPNQFRFLIERTVIHLQPLQHLTTHEPGDIAAIKKSGCNFPNDCKSCRPHQS